MAFPVYTVVATADASDLDAITAGGGTVTGTAVNMSRVSQGSLSALVDVTIATPSLTLTPTWEVSDDSSSWYVMQEGSGPAGVAISATGNKVLACPEAARAWKFSRVKITTSAHNATTGDTYSITTRYIKRQTFDASAK